MHAATDNVATAVIVVVVIVCVGIVSVIVAVGSEADPYKRTSVKSSTVEATARETSMKAATAEATTKSTAMEAASAAHAASTAAAATSVTAATTTAAATSECRGWLNQADRCHCEQGYNRFSHSAFPSLDEAPPKAHNTFAAGLFERSKSARSKLTVSIANLIVHHPERTQTKA
jgi:hypothetical protein